MFSQKQIQGIITDANTTKPLPFATVLTNTNLISLTNVDGTFVIKWSENINSVKISYVGYEPTIIQFNNT